MKLLGFFLKHEYHRTDKVKLNCTNIHKCIAELHEGQTQYCLTLWSIVYYSGQAIFINGHKDRISDNFSFQNNGIKKCTCWKTMFFL